jgi:hypothetical protein
MDDGEIDRERVAAMAGAMMVAICDNYARGPTSRERVFEALNALAFCAAITVAGCGDDTEPLEFFSDAVNRQLALIRDNPPGPAH